ncbi:hypothetical protein HY798_01680 [Candidatus Falkowbacteria bacterium]|nr:hypothetical protein [Candidatus Falkowbacteria bacterium]
MIRDMGMTKKEQFLEEHNRLSPSNLQATMPLLSCFRAEKTSVFNRGDDWSIDKHRRPFILWLLSLTPERKDNIG